MISNKSSLKKRVWLYLSIFSIVILSFLWFFQVVFLKTYYKWDKKREMNKIVSEVINNYNTNTFDDYLMEVSFNHDICVQIVGNNVTNNTRDCLMEGGKNFTLNSYIQKFIYSSLDKATYEIINPRFKNETLISAFKLDTNVYGYIITSLEPLDSTIAILSKQLIIVTFLVLMLSFIIGYFISRKIASPIVKMNTLAKKFSKKEFDEEFDEEFDVNTGICELNELASTLNVAKKELAQTEELRREFLANVSHDLKTPLTMIEAYAEMVRDLTYNNEEKRNQNLNIIIDETKRLNLLVNDILLLSKMQSGIADLKCEKFDLVATIKTIIERFQILSETEGYNFIFTYNKPLYVNADYKKIEQVIYNLLTNAVNYTGEDKKIYITIKNEKDFVNVSIKDTGKGIKNEDKKLVWEKYYKSDKKHKRNQYGTGLGLSIVQNILEAHNSDYGFTSIDNKGTTFYFSLKKEK